MTGTPVKPHPWTVEASRVEYSDRFLTHRMDRCVTERGHVLDPFHIIEMREWCHCVALTADGELVLVEEYRHGAGAVVRALPAGTVEAGEDPAAAMRRELTEETCYVADTWVRLPAMWANPAMQTNKAHNFLAIGAHPAGIQDFDPGETIEVVLQPAAEAIAALLSGAWLTNALHAGAILAAREYAIAHADADPRLKGLAAPLRW